MKKSAAILASITFLLSACSSSDEVIAPPWVPLDCAKTKVMAAFPERIPNPKYVATDWEPAEGTDLYAAYSVGGIACSYGIQEAEVGATVIWAPNFGDVWDQRSAEWIAAGQKEVDLPGVSETKAFALTEGEAGQGEFHVWAVNVLIDGFWIHIGATFFGSIEEAVALVQAAANSLIPAEEVDSKRLNGCYYSDAKGDLFVLDINYHENTTVRANVSIPLSGNNSSTGVFVGNYENGILHGIYSFSSEGIDSKRELFFRRVPDGFIPGFGPMQVAQDGVERLQRPLQLDWELDSKYIPGEDCQAVIQGNL